MNIQINPNDLLTHTGIQSYRLFVLESQVEQLVAENAALKAQIAASTPAPTTAAAAPAAPQPATGQAI